jgi:hypothetical protein
MLTGLWIRCGPGCKAKKSRAGEGLSFIIDIFYCVKLKD